MIPTTRILTGLVLCVSLSARAEPLTLEQVVSRTLSSSFDLRVADQNVTTAAAGTRAALAAPKPRVALQYAAQASDNPLDSFASLLNTRSVEASDFDPDRLNDPGTSTLFSGGVLLEYPLYRGERFSARIDQAERGETASRWRRERARQVVVFRAVQAYYGAQTATRGLNIAEAAEKAAMRHARTTRRLVAEDRTVASDQLTAEVNLAAYRSAREQVAGGLRRALSRLKVAMGEPQMGDISVPPMALNPGAPVLAVVRELEQRAMQQRADLTAAQESLAASTANVAAVQAENKPRVDLRLSTAWYEDDPLVNENSWQVMGVVSKDLYNGGRIRSRVAQAQSRAKALELEIESLKQRILGEVRVAYAHVEEARSRIRIAQGNVRTAQRNVKLIQDRYGEGRAILIELLGAERGLVEARNEELAAVQALVSGLVELRLADGSLDPDQPAGYRLQP